MTSDTLRTPSLGEVAYLAYWRRWPATPLPARRCSCAT